MPSAAPVHMHEAKLLDLTAAKNPMAMAKAIREAVEQRQAARVPADVSAAVALSEQLATDLARASDDPGRMLTVDVAHFRK